jgi:sphingolipid delta-4 desaturase
VSDFAVSHEGEPHSRRRRELLKAHPELRTLFGYDPRSAWTIAALVAVQLSLAALVAWTRPPVWAFVLLAWAIGAVFAHWLAMGIHEASHDLCLRSERQNRWLAILANVPLFAPTAMAFRRFHLDHHTYLGVPGKDNDLPARGEARLIGASPWRKALWLCSFLLIAMFGRGFLKRPTRWEWINIAVQVPVVALQYWLLGPWGLGYLVLSTFFGTGPHPVAGHWIHEHYLFKPGQETYSYYGILNRVTFNVGYHNEHHDLMGIPGSRLPDVRRIAPEFYEPLESSRSWLAIQWRFVVDRGLSHFSRMTRSWETYLAARRTA